MSRIVLRDSIIDFRDYLDNEPIHNGDQLLLWQHEQWVPVRYELASFAKREVILWNANGGVQLDREQMEFVWPK